MKFTAVLAFVAAATVVSASTNAERLARGLPPHAPGKRASPALRARRSTPSGTSWGGQCNGGSVHCCNDVQQAHSGNTCDRYLKQLGIFGDVSPGTNVGVQCSPIGAGAVGAGSQCSSQTVCCTGEQHGLINIGCMPINLNL